MCGLAGILTTSGLSEDALRCATHRMIAPIAHRGPDDDGVWVDAHSGVALGFRRLAIIDLSEQGHQPMRSESGRYTIVFNGEVYNHKTLRAVLESCGCRFRGHSDTEVMLAAFEQWGILSATQRFVGMFAFAVWDASTHALSLIRDRQGIKPLYVYAEPGLVTFGSELKALAAGPSFDRAIDRTALSAYLRYLYVPSPRTIYQRAIKLEPGCLLTVRDAEADLPAPEPYWSAEEAARRGLAEPFDGSDDEATDALDRILSGAVRLQMQADVPLGAMLSGGIDSSTVVALMQAATSNPVKTFSIAFEEAEYNEAPHAARVAAHLGTQHTELMLTGADALATVPLLAQMYDEPHADPSQIPTYLVCALARQHVTVALSGDGGDEVFGGYNRYSYGEEMLERVGQVPRPARRALAAVIGSVSPASWNRAHDFAYPVLPRAMRVRLPGEKLGKLGRLMRSDSQTQMYRSLVSAWQEPERVVIGGLATTGTVERILAAREPRRLLHRIMLADQLTNMVDDQLTKVDRASMAVSLEVRVPLLDHRVVEFSWTLPASMKIRDGKGKWLLRQLLYRHVPRAIIDREKMGFSVPIASWLRGPLRSWAEDLLAPASLEAGGLLRAAPVRRAWSELLAGREESGLSLWSVLMFQAWKHRWLT